MAVGPIVGEREGLVVVGADVVMGAVGFAVGFCEEGLAVWGLVGLATGEADGGLVAS